jgi:hypothetical protein
MLASLDRWADQGIAPDKGDRFPKSPTAQSDAPARSAPRRKHALERKIGMIAPRELSNYRTAAGFGYNR